MLASQKTELIDYITARLELEFDAERQAIAAVGGEPGAEKDWAWVQQGRARREGIKGLVRVLAKQDGDSALMWLASTWSAHVPLVDRRGRPYTSNVGGLVYLTECCQTTATYSDTTLCCRVCYEEVDGVLNATPITSSVDTPWRGHADQPARGDFAQVVADAWNANQRI